VNLQNYEILQKVEEIFRKANKYDLVLIYYSGHGKLSGKGRLLLTTKNTRTDLLISTSIPIEIIKILMTDSKTKKVVVILDCCYSGLAGEELSKGDMDDLLQSVSKSNGIYILTSSTGSQQSYEDESEDYGLFTKHLIDGIRSRYAVNGEGNITIESLFSYIEDKMRFENKQTPRKWNLNISGEIVIARIDDEKKEERKKKIISKIHTLFQENIIPHPIYLKVIEIMDPGVQMSSSQDILREKLLDKILEDSFKPGDFIENWYKIDKVAEVHLPEPVHFEGVTSKLISLEIDPPSRDANKWINLGQYLNNQWFKHDEAIKAYEKALELDPRNQFAWTYKGVALCEVGDYNGAIMAHNMAIELNPKFYIALNNKGIALDKLGKYNDAIKAYNEAITLKPKYADAWFNKGRALRKLGKKGSSNEAFSEAKKFGLCTSLTEIF
jgi:lipoprotein NlpI